MKTIYLVTGAAGFMGTNVCAQLLERGDAVRAFVLKGDPAVKFMPKAVEIIEGDLCSAEDCEKFFAVEPGTQTVCIHCASMVTINPNYSEKLIAVNVGGAENMLNALLAMGTHDDEACTDFFGCFSDIGKNAAFLGIE